MKIGVNRGKYLPGIRCCLSCLQPINEIHIQEMIKFTRHRGIAKAIQLEKKLIITMNFNSDRIVLEIFKEN